MNIRKSNKRNTKKVKMLKNKIKRKDEKGQRNFGTKIIFII